MATRWNPDSIVVQGNWDGIAVGSHGTLIMTNSTVQANLNVGMRAVAGSGAHPVKSSLVASDISDALRAEVARHAGERCEYCLIHELEAGFPHQVDHIVSRKHGGESTSDNLAYACVDLQSVLRQ